MSQTPMTLQTTLAHKPFAWRRWLMILVVVTLISGGLWWAKETGRLDRLLAGSTTTNTTINSAASAQQLAASANSNAVAAQSSAGVNPISANQSQATKTTDRSAQPATTSTVTTSTDRVTKTETTAAIAASRSVVAVAGIDGVQVWNAEGQRLTTLDIGAKLQATARTADGQWLTVEADNATGWAQATQVVAFDLADLPVTTLAAPVLSAPGKTDSPQPIVTTEAAAADNNAPVAETVQPATIAEVETKSATTVSADITAIVTTSGANLNVRSGPATTYALVTKVANGATVTVLGRDESGSWLQIQFATATADTGWVTTQYLQIDSALDGLPVVTTVTD